MWKDLLSVTGDYLTDLFRDVYEKGTGERWKLFLSPFFCVLLWWTHLQYGITDQLVWKMIDLLLNPFRGWLGDMWNLIHGILGTVFCPLFGMAAVIVISDVLSVLIMNRFLSDPSCELCFLKHSAYEKTEDHYYLKLDRIYQRQFLVRFEKLTPILFLIMEGVLAAGTGEEVPADMIRMTEGIFLWMHQKGRYLNHKTLEEDRSWGRVTKKQKHLNYQKIYQMLSEKKKYGISFFRCFFSGSCAVQSQEQLFPERYSELFNKLMEDKSVLVTNAFYHDWERAFFIPVHRFLLKDRRVIIMAGAFMDACLLKEWAEQELARMIGIRHSWSVEIWDVGAVNWNILIVRYEDIPRFTEEIRAQKKNIQGVFVTVLDPSRMVVEMKPYLEYMADCLHTMDLPPVYCFADREMMGLLDSLSHIFRTKIEGVSIDWQNSHAFYCYGVDESSRGEAEKYRGPVSYLGKGVSVAAQLMETEEAVIYASDGLEPVKDSLTELKKQLMSRLMDRKDWVKQRLNEYKTVNSFWEIQTGEDGCMIADDGNHNFYEMGRLLSGRKRSWAHLFVLSGEYLLRDYMWENAEKQMFQKNLVPVFFPVYQDTERNRLIRLLYKSQRLRLCRQDVTDLFPEYQKERRVFDRLNAAGRENLIMGRGFEALRQKSSDIWEMDETFRGENQWWMGEVYLVDEKKDQEILGCRRMGQVYQWLLPGQYLCLRGCYYMLARVEKQGDIYRLVLKRSSSFVRQAENYRQKRTYYVYKSAEEPMILTDAVFRMERWVCCVLVRTSGYIEKRKMDGGNRLWERERTYDFDIPARRYKKKGCLFLSLQSADNPEIAMLKKEEKRRIYEGLAVLLTEMAKTIFPCHYPYLAILLPGGKSAELSDALYDLRIQGAASDEQEGILIVEDSMEDIGLLETFGLHLQLILSLCRRYCQWAVNGNNYFGIDSWMTMIGELNAFWKRTEEREPKKPTAGNPPEGAAVMDTARGVQHEAELAQREAAGSDEEAKTEIIEPACMACGEKVPYRLLFQWKQYCADCRECENQQYDYVKAQVKIWHWFEDVMGIDLGVWPKVRLRPEMPWDRLQRKPVDTAIFSPKSKITCRLHMDKNCIELHMVYACIKMWYKRHKKICRVRVKNQGDEKWKKCDTLSHWFQVQYLYLTKGKDAAETFRNYVITVRKDTGLKDMAEEFPFVGGEILSEKDMERLLKENPIARILGR